MSVIERIKVHALVSIFWRSKVRMLSAVNGFQATEADGVWHLLRGIEGADDPKVRATLFEHMIEEESHAEAFGQVCRAESVQAFAPTFYEREDIFPPDTPVWKLIAYVHVGEVDATARFGVLRDALPPGRLKEALKTIVADEEGHIDLTHSLLLELGATESEIRKTYRQVRLRRGWEGWLRSGKRVVNWVAVTLLSAVYFAMAPFFYRTARAKLLQHKVVYDNNRIKGAR
jgi:hypothetical protein